MSKKELSIKIVYLRIVFDTLKTEEMIRKIRRLPLEYFMIQKAKVKHKDYTNLCQFGTIKVYGDRQLNDGTSEAGCYLVLSGQGCDDYYSFLQTSRYTYSDFFSTCIQILGNGAFHLTRLDIAIDDKNEISYFTVEQIKRKCLKDEYVSKSKSNSFMTRIKNKQEKTSRILFARFCIPITFWFS